MISRLDSNEGCASSTLGGYFPCPQDANQNNFAETRSYHGQTLDEPRFTDSNVSNQNIVMQEDNKMSLVGIMNNSKVGLIAFGDSRGSYCQHGQLIRETGQHVKKVFCTEKFLLVTFGPNEYMGNGSVKPLSWLLEQTIANHPDLPYHEFLKIIKEKLAETFAKEPNIIYHFICGFRDDLEEEPLYGTEFCEIERTKINFKGVNFLRHIAYGGTTDMLPQKMEVNANWSMEEMENVCVSLLEHCVSLGDLFFPYNPVGLPVQIEKMQ